jgi:hypothetical protein
LRIEILRTLHRALHPQSEKSKSTAVTRNNIAAQNKTESKELADVS